VVVGSPVWFWSVTGQAKTFLDRLYAMQYPKKRLMNKVGAAVVVAGRQGKTRALDVILEALRSHRMILADTIDGLGYEPGEIRRTRGR
jgi:multimeric flavodoxin WrbA